jgi:hypothetical protein
MNADARRLVLLYPRLSAFICVSLLLVAGAGCASQQGNWHGPESAALVRTSPWSYRGRAGEVLATPHYRIHTTVTEPDVLAKLPQVLEGAYGRYRVFAGGVAVSERPLDCYVFGKRDEWADFTQSHTGADAAVYLQITRGGYTVGDWFVSYFVGANATYSVAAHEGWHQFVARNFAGRLPPFLEEGTACMFESVRFVNDLPRWDVAINPSRTLALRNAIEAKTLWPLEKLVTMHAGDVVRLPGDRVEAFYAQSWAFALFLEEYNHGEYLPAFRKLMADTARGNPNDRGQAVRKALNLWSPASVKPLLERYLGKDLATIAGEYDQFIHAVAYDQFTRQWSAKPG